MSDLKAATRPAPAYDGDFYAWTQDQAEKLRARRHNEIDWENVAEEIDSVGRSDKRSIRSDLSVILVHLLKWQYQPEKRKGGWAASIVEHRNRLHRILDDSPSLGGFPAEVLEREYEGARWTARAETHIALDAIPERSPFTIEQVLDPAFPPDLYEDLAE